MSIDKKILLLRFSLVLIVSLAAFGADPNAPATSAQLDPNTSAQGEGDPNAPAPPPQSNPNAPAQVDPNAPAQSDPNAPAPPPQSDPNAPAPPPQSDPNAPAHVDPNAPAQVDPNAAPPKLPLGFVRGDVVSYSYVPIRHWSPKEGIGILPYLFEYNLQAHKDGTPLEAFHDENIRRIDIASKWSTVIMLYPRQPEYRDEIINLMLRCFKNHQLIIMADYHDGLTESAYLKVRDLLDKLWQDRDKTLVSPEGDMATGLQLINNVLAG